MSGTPRSHPERQRGIYGDRVVHFRLAASTCSGSRVGRACFPLKLTAGERFILVEVLIRSLDEPDEVMDDIWAEEAEAPAPTIRIHEPLTLHGCPGGNDARPGHSDPGAISLHSPTGAWNTTHD